MTPHLHPLKHCFSTSWSQTLTFRSPKPLIIINGSTSCVCIILLCGSQTSNHCPNESRFIKIAPNTCQVYKQSLFLVTKVVIAVRCRQTYHVQQPVLRLHRSQVPDTTKLKNFLSTDIANGQVIDNFPKFHHIC